VTHDTPPRIRVGLNARLFPGIWRPATSEIHFARQHGFDGLQFAAPVTGLDAQRLGAPLAEVAEHLRDTSLARVMEILVLLDTDGRTREGLTPLDALEHNLPTIRALGVTHVHWHLAPALPDKEPFRGFERRLLPQFRAALDIAANEGFTFAFEHNEPRIALLATPEDSAALLNELPGLGFVFDLNHATPEQLPGYLALAGRTTMLHVADTPLPTVNAHKPLGHGNIDLAAYVRALHAGGFEGLGVLEIGGQPWSGGYGQDTDETLITSARLLREATLAAAT